MNKPWFSPTPELGLAPAAWADVLMMAATVWGEAEGEEYPGKVGVAYVIDNRVKDPRWPNTATEVCLDPNQFSCWNTGSPRIAGMKNPHAHTTEAIWNDCFKAAIDAMYSFLPDPTKGANHYLNPVVTRKLRGGTMPSWYTPERIVARLGDHEFLRL